MGRGSHSQTLHHQLTRGLPVPFTDDMEDGVAAPSALLALTWLRTMEETLTFHQMGTVFLVFFSEDRKCFRFTQEQLNGTKFQKAQPTSFSLR